MKRISKLQTIFSLLKPGECITIASVLAMIAGGIVYSNYTKYSDYASTKAANEKKESEQKSWIARESEIDKRFQDVIDDIRNRQHIDESKLMDIVKNTARKLSLKYDIEMPETLPGKFFTFHKISIHLNGVYFTDLLAFDKAIEVEDSSLCIDDMKLSLSGRQLSATLGISSLDIKADENASTLVAKILNSHNLSEKLIMWNDRSSDKNLIE